MGLPKVNIYSYTAAANPYFVKALAHKYGYEFDKTQSLSSVLQQLVTFEGEPALFDIIEANPDKELFMEYFEKKHPKKDEKAEGTKTLDAYLNFSGQLAAVQTAENKRVTTETSLMVLAGAILIAFAILSKK
jgi:hypothetical protein